MMANNKNQGGGIDPSKHIFGNEGETVGGSTEDDLGEEVARILPDGISEDDLSDKERKAVEKFIVEGDRANPKFVDLAEGEDFSHATAQRGIHKVFRDTRDIYDIPNGSALAVLIWSHHGINENASKLANKYPISDRTLSSARNVYPDLIEDVDISKSDLEAYVEQYEQTRRKPPEKNKKYNHGIQKKAENKEYPDDFTERQQWYIETIAENPHMDASEVLEAAEDEGLNYDTQGYYNLVSKYPKVVRGRIEELGHYESQDEISDYLKKKVYVDQGEDKKITDYSNGDVPESVKQEIAELYHQGYTGGEISEEVGVPADRIGGFVSIWKRRGDYGFCSAGNGRELEQELDFTTESELETSPEPEPQPRNVDKTSERGPGISLGVDELYDILQSEDVPKQTKKTLLERAMSTKGSQ